MTISGIGVQQILPQTGTAWQGANTAQDSPNNSDGADAPAANPDRPPPAPGTGRIVDRIA